MGHAEAREIAGLPRSQASEREPRPFGELSGQAALRWVPLRMLQAPLRSGEGPAVGALGSESPKNARIPRQELERWAEAWMREGVEMEGGVNERSIGIFEQ